MRMKRYVQSLVPEASQFGTTQRRIVQRQPISKVADVIFSAVATYGREVVEGLIGLVGLGIIFIYLPLAIVTTHLALFVALILSCICAVRYRRGSIYVIAPLITGAYLLAYLTRMGNGQLPATVDVFFLLIIPIALSEITLAQRQRIAQVETLREQDTQRMEALMQHQREVLAANAELVAMVEGMPVTLATLCGEIARLAEAHGSDRYEAITQITAQALTSESCALYLRREHQYALVAHLPPARSDVEATLPADDAVIASALITRRVATVQACLAQSADSPAQCIMAGPLLDQEGKIAGMLVIERMPFLQCTPLATQLFMALLPLIERALNAEEALSDGTFGTVVETRQFAEITNVRRLHAPHEPTDGAEMAVVQVFALEDQSLPDQLIS